MCSESTHAVNAMGIDTQFRRWLKETASPSSFLGEAPPLERHPRGWVYIDDVLTVAHWIRGPRFNHTFTGIELFNALIQPIVQRLRGNSVFSCAVICADDYARVPKQKLQTQQKRGAQFVRQRAAKRAAEELETKEAPPLARASEQLANGFDIPVHLGDFRYPEHSVISDDGIEYTGREDHQLHREAIDLPLLLRSRPVMRVLWAYVRDRLEQMARTGSALTPTVPHDRVLIIDHFDDGPWYICGNRCGRLPPVPFGEGEVQAAFWSRVFHCHPTIVSTIDTDILPLTVGNKGTLEREAPLYWCYRDGASSEHVDLISVARDMNALHLHPDAFRALCVTGGTDFFFKRDVLHYVGVPSLIAAALWATPHLVQAADDTENTGKTSRHFEWFLRAAYAVQGKYPSDKDSPPPPLQQLQSDMCARSANYDFPTPDRLHEALSRLQWNFAYWNMDRARATLAVYEQCFIALGQEPRFPASVASAAASV